MNQRIRNTTRPTNSSKKDLSREELLVILQKKKECNARALVIVEAFCEPGVKENCFLDKLALINQNHYDDVVTERSITKLCGYPLCSNKLGNVPKQQFRISLSKKTVYDITDRKKFCSNHCYKSSDHVKNQLLTSPLWFRESERIPVINLLRSKMEETTTDTISKNSETKAEFPIHTDDTSDATDVEAVVECSTDAKVKCGSSVDYTEDTSDSADVETVVKFSAGDEDQRGISLDATEDTNDSKEKIDTVLNQMPETYATLASAEKMTQASANSNQKVASLPENVRVEKEKVQLRRIDTSPTEYIDPIKKVENAIDEWLGIKSLIYLLGEEAVIAKLKTNESAFKELSNKATDLTPFHRKFDELTKVFSMLNFVPEEATRDLKPLPDYSALKADTKDLTVKVRAFYSGQLESGVVGGEETSAKDKEDYFELPLVDSHAQNALRRRVFLDRLNRVMPDVCESLEVGCVLDSSDVTSLAKTFTLSAHNVTFQPREWFLVCLILIKLLTWKHPRLKEHLLGQLTKKRTTLLLLSYNLPPDYVDNLAEWLTDSEHLLSKLQS